MILRTMRRLDHTSPASFMTCFPSAPSTHRGVGLSELDDLWNQTYRRAFELCDQQIPRTKEYFGAKAVSPFC